MIQAVHWCLLTCSIPLIDVYPRPALKHLSKEGARYQFTNPFV